MRAEGGRWEAAGGRKSTTLVARRSALLSAAVAILLGASSALLGVCGPFTDTAADAFCPFVLEIFYLGITTGTTPTTYSPGDSVTRLQMAAFLSRGVDRVLQRAGPRAVLGRTWTTQGASSLGLTTVGPFPVACACDGADVWAVSGFAGTVSRVRASDGRLLETWTGAVNAYAAAAAPQGILVASSGSPSSLYRIDPIQPAGAVTTVVSVLCDLDAFSLVVDGRRIWATCESGLSIVTPGPALPWTVTTVTTGFSALRGPVFDGNNVWVTDDGTGTVLKLDAAGAILQTVTVGTGAGLPLFDGTNIWVPGFGASAPLIAVVRPSSGAVLATLTGNGLSNPWSAAFDGERILVTNNLVGEDHVSLWRAADLAPLGSFSTGAGSEPVGPCSDGANFWVTLFGAGQIARF